MNCHCQPGQLAVKRVSNKNNQNRGKEFYVCPIQSCNFFLWADSKVPVTLHARVPPSSSSSFRPNSSSSSSISNNYGRTNAQQSAPPSNLPTAKMTLVAIENNTAYVGLTCQYNVSINNFMQKHHDCCKFDYSRKLWTFDLKIYDSVVQLLRDAGYQPEELPRFLSDGIRKYFAKVQRPSPASSSSSSSSHQVYGMQNQEKERNGELLNQPSDIKLNISSSLSSILLPFQVEGVKFIINHCGRGLIGDEMGCGKTIQAIALLQHYRAHWPAIVLIPTNLMVQWKEELLKYCHDCLSSQDICCVKTGKDHLYGKITIIPYSLIGQFVDRQELLSERFGMIIADESHKLKNSDSKTASYVVPLLKTIPIAICLSGTPMMNRPVELYTQLNGLQPTIFYDYHGFLFRYCDAKQDSLGFLDKKGASNESELKLLLETFIMIRRLKEQVIQELPDKKRERLYVEVDQSYAGEINRIQKLTNYIDSEMKNPMKDQEEKRKLSQQREQLLLEYYRVTGLSKIGGIKREVLRLIEAARVQKAIAESALDEAEKEDKDKVKEECAEGIKEPEELLISEETVAKLETRQSSQKKTGKDLISDEDVLVDTDDDIDNNKDEECTWTESASEYEDELKDTDDESDSDLYFNKRKASKSDKDSSKRRKLGEPKRKGKIKASTSSCVDLTGEENVEIQKKDKSKQKKDALAFIQDTFFTVKDEKPKRPKLMLSNKILVFAHHLAVLDAVEDILRESQVGYVRVDGGTTTSKKATLISKFQNDDETDVALLSITACGTGLNLTRANVAVFAEMYWSPGINGQAEDRIHRIGQKSDEVRIIYILARNTADDIVWEQIQKKSSTIGATIGNAERTRYSRSVGGKENQKKQQHTLEKFIGSQASVSSVHDNYQNNNMNTQDVYHNVPTVDLSELTFQQLDNSCQDFILQQALDSANAQNSLEPAIYPTKNYVYDTSYPPPPTSQGISLVSALPSSSNQVYSNCVVLNQEINDDMWESYSAVPHQTITQPPPLPPQIQHQPLMQIPAATTQRRPFSSSSPAQIPKVSTFISSPPPFSPSLSQAPSVSIVNHQSVGRPSSLPEEAVARAERNRLEAQRRLALTREREKLERLRQEAL